MHLLRVKACTKNYYWNYCLHTHACNWHTSLMASFKRQPEKKDALLMRRRGPCSEKARRGLQSWENPAQHKQKHGKEKKGGRGKKKNKRHIKTWTAVSECVRRKAGCLLWSDHIVAKRWATGAFSLQWNNDHHLVGQSVIQTNKKSGITHRKHS